MDDALAVAALPFVRAIAHVQAEDKIEPRILADGPNEDAVNADGTFSLRVLFYRDVTLEEVLSLVAGHGGTVHSMTPD